MNHFPTVLSASLSASLSALLLALPISASAVQVDFDFAALVSGNPYEAFEYPSVAAALPIGTSVSGSIRFDAPFPTTQTHATSGSVQIGTQTYAVVGATSFGGRIENGQLFDTVGFSLLGATIPSSDSSYTPGILFIQLSGLPDPDPLALPVALDLGSEIGVTFTDNNHGSYFNDVPLTVRSAEIAAAVPEPATWATLAAGLGIVGWAGRTKRRIRAL